jgi:hypothetical protein
MSVFVFGSIEEEILADTQYTQRQKGASNIEIVKALISVLEYYANEIEGEGDK